MAIAIPASRRNGKTEIAAATSTPSQERRAPDTGPRAVFLRTIHNSACRIFGTTLGPEANEAHRNHFHLDMYPRRRRGYCE